MTKAHNTLKNKGVRVSDGEWEVIKAFAKVLKDDPERAARMMAAK